MSTLLRLLVLCTLIAVASGCGGPPTKLRFQLDELYENNFRSLQVPSAEEIKAGGVKKELPYATFDQAWDSAIVVLAQHGVIVRSQRDTGIIVVASALPVAAGSALIKLPSLDRYIIAATALPVAALVEKAEIVAVYLKGMEDLYKRLDSASQVASPQTPTMDPKQAKSVLDEIATQTYSHEKWKYLLLESSTSRN